MILNLFQKKLEDIYGLSGLPRIENYILEKESVKTLLGKDHDPAPQLMIQEDQEELFLGVYFGEQSSNGNLYKSPVELHAKDFCEIAEEVSHFIYLSWSAQNSQPRSLLDLELQAEVDKWILMQGLCPHIDAPFRVIFEDFSLRATLTTDEKSRYLRANKMAVRFLKGHFLKQTKNAKGAIDFLRQFYRRATSLRISELSRL